MTASRIVLLFLGVFLGPVMMLSCVGSGFLHETCSVRNGSEADLHRMSGKGGKQTFIYRFWLGHRQRAGHSAAELIAGLRY
jgi:hypothetical protein